MVEGLMAETLGSLVDKLTIKEIRAYHLQEMVEQGSQKFSRDEVTSRLALLADQKNDLMKEINTYVQRAFHDDHVVLRDEKIKLYNARDVMGRVGLINGIGEAISGLAQKNLALWHLEDEARRQDVSLEYIGEIKQKIDPVNQQRNDFIDKIDELFAEAVHSSRKAHE